MPKKTPHTADENELKRRFGASVRRYRQKLAISQEELAWRAEMHRTYLADVERGARNLSLSSMARLIGAIGVSLSAFFAVMESIDLASAPGSLRGKAPNGARGKPKGSSRGRRR